MVSSRLSGWSAQFGLAVSAVLALAAICGCGADMQGKHPAPRAAAAKTDEKRPDGVGRRYADMSKAEPMKTMAMKTSAAEHSAMLGSPQPSALPPSPPSPPTAPASPGPDGKGPGMSGDKFAHITENPFAKAAEEPLSTFSIDVDTASYSKTRMFLLEHQSLPPPDAVRIEELLNYFSYDYAGPKGDEHPFAAHVEVAQCPWQRKHRLVRIGVKAKEMDRRERPPSNLVFLVDVSGSMDAPNRLPLVQRGLKMLVDQLGENDRVAIVVYASATGLVLDSTPCLQKSAIVASLDRLKAGGSTNGGAGIQLAYQTALNHFIKGGVNRVVLCTDGDFNVGVTSPGDLVRLAETNAKKGVKLSVLGFGMGNHNDSMLEQLSNKADGNYYFIDTDHEARKVLVEQMSATLVTIAKDVKIQVEFNPAKVAAYRLIGYEDRLLQARDFNDDKKDAGEIGAGHSVTALYEVVPAGVAADEKRPAIDDLRYQAKGKLSDAAASDELLTLKLRYQKPEGSDSTLVQFPVKDSSQAFDNASADFRFAAAVAQFGLLLRNSAHKGDANFDAVIELVSETAAKDKSGYRQEFLDLARAARRLAK